MMHTHNLFYDSDGHTGQCWKENDFIHSSLVHSELLGAHSRQDVDSNSAGSKDSEANQQGDSGVHADVHALMDVDTFLPKSCYNAGCNHHKAEKEICD